MARRYSSAETEAESKQKAENIFVARFIANAMLAVFYLFFFQLEDGCLNLATFLLYVTPVKANKIKRTTKLPKKVMSWLIEPTASVNGCIRSCLAKSWLMYSFKVKNELTNNIGQPFALSFRKREARFLNKHNVLLQQPLQNGRKFPALLF